jgi:hypothetical protein
MTCFAYIKARAQLNHLLGCKIKIIYWSLAVIVIFIIIIIITAYIKIEMLAQ